MRLVVLISIVMVMVVSCSSNSKTQTNDPYSFRNILNIKNIPSEAKDPESFAFFDQGSWFGFGLVPDSLPEYYGGFSGPFLMTDWRWSSEQLARFYLLDETDRKEIDLKNATLVANDYLPGRLIHHLQYSNR